MKKHINKLLLLGSLIFLGASCENDAELTTLESAKFTSEIEASSNTLLLTEDNANEVMELFSWQAIDYVIDAPVTYVLQFDLIGNISGNNAWQNSKRITVGEDVLSKSFIGKDLNKIAIDLGLQPNEESKLAVRVEATMDHKAYSDPIIITITPYEKSVVFGEIYMPGGYDWNIETCAALTAIEKGVYQGYVYFPVGSYLGFKLNTARSWNQFYGAGASNNDLQNMSDTDFQMTNSGAYRVNVNLNTLKWNATPYSWGIVGDATAGSWDSSTPMTYNHILKVWTITTNLNAGNLKFRLNNSWTVNFGPKNSNDGIVYLDDPGAHYLGEAGTYKITLQINDITGNPGDRTTYPATATYTVTKL